MLKESVFLPRGLCPIKVRFYVRMALKSSCCAFFLQILIFLDQKQQIRFENFRTIRSQPLTEDLAIKILKEEGGQRAYEHYRQGTNQILVGPINIRDYTGCESCFYFQEAAEMVRFYCKCFPVQIAFIVLELLMRNSPLCCYLSFMHIHAFWF